MLKVTIRSHDIALLLDIKENVGFGIAAKVLLRMYPDLSPKQALDIIKDL